MNYTKTRLRNRMQYELLESLLRIINYTNVNKTCCNSFQPDENMIKKFNSNNMYEHRTSTNETEESEVYNLIEVCCN